MDRETLTKMKQAQKIADENRERQKKAQDFNNVEFWEEKLKILEQNKEVFVGNLAETEFLIECYKKKIEDTEKKIKK